MIYQLDTKKPLKTKLNNYKRKKQRRERRRIRSEQDYSMPEVSKEI
jgi:hypothetical protein